ncbi:MAG: PAS domain-containing protein [Spirochaetes bacterium]|nr:PAS domain-containing protein [Spirochaetota bacterium]
MNRRGNKRHAGRAPWLPGGYFQRLLDLLPCVVFEIDTEGRLLYLNRKGIERFGYGTKAYRGSSIYPHIGGESKILRNGMEQALLQKETVCLPLETAGPENGRVIALITLTAAGTSEDAGRIQGLVQEAKPLDAAMKKRERIFSRLQATADSVETLKGLLPICAHCKRIRDEGGKWHLLEDYLHAHTKAEFSHGLCPECLQTLYPDLFERQKELEFDREDDTPSGPGPE